MDAPIRWDTMTNDEIVAEVQLLVELVQAEPVARSVDVHPDDLEAIRSIVPAAQPELYAWTTMLQGLPLVPVTTMPLGLALVHMTDGSTRWLEIRAGAADAAGLGPTDIRSHDHGNPPSEARTDRPSGLFRPTKRRG